MRGQGRRRRGDRARAAATSARPRRATRWPTPEIQAAAIATALRGLPAATTRRAGWRSWRSSSLAVIPPLVARRFGAFFAVLAGLIATARVRRARRAVAFNAGLDRARRGAAGRRRPSRWCSRRSIAAPARVPLGTAAGADRPGGRQPPHAPDPHAAAAQRGGRASCSLGVAAAGDERAAPDRPRHGQHALRGPRQAEAAAGGRASRSTTRRSPRRSGTWPMNRRPPREGDPQPARKAGAKVIAYDVQFTEPSGDTAKQDADNDLIEAVARRVPDDGDGDHRGRVRRPHGDLRRRRRARATAKATPANSNYLNDPDGKIRRMGVQARRTSRRSRSRPPRRCSGATIAAARGQRGWIDYPGPAGDASRYISFDRRRDRQVRPGGGARARSSSSARPRRSLQDHHLTSTTSGVHDARPGDPGRGDRARRSTGFPLRSGAAVARLRAADRRSALAGAAGRAAAADRPGRGDRRASASPRCSSSRRWRSTHGTIITVVYAVIAGIAGDPRHRRDPRPDRRVRARAGARRVRALRARGGRGPGAGRRRRRAPRRRARRGDGHVQRPARVHLVQRDARAGARDRVAEPLPDRDERGDPRPRRHARGLHGRRHHGRVRRAAEAGRPRRPGAGGGARHARADGGLQRLAARAGPRTTASRWASGSTAGP